MYIAVQLNSLRFQLKISNDGLKHLLRSLDPVWTTRLRPRSEYFQFMAASDWPHWLWWHSVLTIFTLSPTVTIFDFHKRSLKNRFCYLSLRRLLNMCPISGHRTWQPKWKKLECHRYSHSPPSFKNHSQGRCIFFLSNIWILFSIAVFFGDARDL